MTGCPEVGYQLITQFQGTDKRLGIEKELLRLVKGGAQTWQLDRLVDGTYRVRATGDLRCLAAGLRLALVACADTPTSSGS